jgi:hypothetical protein
MVMLTSHCFDLPTVLERQPNPENSLIFFQSSSNPPSSLPSHFPLSRILILSFPILVVKAFCKLHISNQKNFFLFSRSTQKRRKKSSFNSSSNIIQRGSESRKTSQIFYNLLMHQQILSSLFFLRSHFLHQIKSH